jgi:putative transcriptional regulator
MRETNRYDLPRARPPILARLRLLCVVAVFVIAVRASAAEKSDEFIGRLLIATPVMQDPRFVETVIYMVKHDGEGALGLVVNRPIAKRPIQELLKALGADTNGAKGDMLIHYGGPVSPGTGFILHTDDVFLDSSTAIRDGIAVTSDVKLISAIARGKGPRQAMFMMGYAGWASGQLEAELKAEAWFVIPGDRALIFAPDAEKKWRRALDKRAVPL